MILVTGSAGKTGRAALRALGADARPVRALVYREDQVEAAAALGAAEVIVGDMRSPETMARAARGAHAIYHISPNMAPDEVAIAEVAVEAARTAGAERFVYHSVLHPQTEAMPHHWAKLRAEERLLESGLPFTILQPAAYMQNVLAHRQRILEEGVYPVPYAADAALSLVDLEDVAEVAANVLTGPGHEGATYELCSGDALTADDIAKALSGLLGRRVRAEVMSAEDWEAGARETGLGDYPIETLLAMFAYYDRHGLTGSPNVLSWLLGRSPTGFKAFLERELTSG